VSATERIPPGSIPSERILVVDDEPNITDLVATALRYEGFDVAVASTGSEAIREAMVFRPDLVVLDVMLPDRDGYELLTRLRADHVRLPVVFLTARDSTEDKVKGLTVGGDDYVTKPFSLEELLARVRAVLRRTQTTPAAASRLVFGDLELDDDTHEVWRGRTRVELTPTEFNLLRYLMHNARRVVSKAQILDHVWEYDFDGDANVVETYISYLRKKLDPSGPPVIHTVRGVGYTLRLPPED
jgi:two-component system, OmpR family, response regulator